VDHAPTLAYRLCPHCFRAVPALSAERYCVNDGALLLSECSACQAPITSPLARFCPSCGVAYLPVAAKGTPPALPRGSPPKEQEHEGKTR
jgi:hypothetical protein